jgi:hypothetical protein
MLSDEVKNSAYVITLFSKPPYPSEIPKMTPEEHKNFVDGLLKDTIFCSMHIHSADKEKNDLRNIFLSLNSDYLQKMPRSLIEQIGVLWEFMTDKVGTTYRGSVTRIMYPRFNTFRVCTKFDWDLATDAIKAFKARVNLIIPP